MAIWQPQPGPQAAASVCPADFTFFGGSRGGGKSDCLIGRQLAGAEKYGKDWNGLIIRRKYKDFAEIRRRFNGLISEGLPAERIGGDQQTNFIRFKNGAQITMPAISRIEMVNDFVGHQYCEISVDECTTFPFFTRMVDKLKGSNRSPAGVPCRMFGTGNPGGPGHNEVKEFFKLGELLPRTVFYDHAGESRVYIPSFLADNKILCENDPKYVKRLMSIQDPTLRKAWLDGDWDVFIGQAFNFSTERHVINDFSVSDWAEIYTTFDWGYGAPFSWAWWWVDADNRVYRFAEWYGWDGTPNTGLRLSDTDIAIGILERERKLGISNRRITRLSGPDCFSKKPDYKGGGQGPSTAEVFAEHGIHMSPGDPSRHLKIRQFRERLRTPSDDEMPMLMVYRSCSQFIRTIPALCVGESDPEFLDDGQEEHCLCGDTFVITDKGQFPIKKMVGTTGKVLTAGGYWTNYNNCKCMQKNVTIVKVSFENGVSVKCTPDHRFLTEKGIWIEAIKLTNEACHISIPSNKNIKEDILCKLKRSTKQRKSLMGNGFGCAEIITKQKAKDFIRQFGNILTEQSQKAFISIIKMKTEATTKLKTWNAYQQRNICHIMQKKLITPNGQMQDNLLHLIGMEAQKELSGTNNNIRRIARIKSITKRLKELASCATKNLKGLAFQNIVQEDVNKEPGNCPKEKKEFAQFVGMNILDSEKLVQNLVLQKLHGQSVKVKNVKPFGMADVYCLDAAFTHGFAVEGGIIVHNCFDEACHICMARPLSGHEPKKKMSDTDKRIETLKKGNTNTYERYAEEQYRESDQYLHQQEEQQNDMVSTI